MTISFIAASTDGADVATGASATIPASVQSGDRLLAILGTNSVSGYTHPLVDAAILLPGWTLLRTSHASVDGGSQFASLYTKIADSDDASTQLVMDVSPDGSKDVLIIGAYRGTVTTPFVDVSAVLPHSGAGTTGIVSAQVTVTTGRTPSTLVALASKKGGTVEITFTAPASNSMTLRGTDFVTGGGAMAVALADGSTGSDGATTVANWGTNTSSGAATAFLIALYEGDPPVQTAPVFRRRIVTAGVESWFPAP